MEGGFFEPFGFAGLRTLVCFSHRGPPQPNQCCSAEFDLAAVHLSPRRCLASKLLVPLLIHRVPLQSSCSSRFTTACADSGLNNSRMLSELLRGFEAQPSSGWHDADGPRHPELIGEPTLAQHSDGVQAVRHIQPTGMHVTVPIHTHAELEAIQELQELCDRSSAFADQQLVPRLFEPVRAHCPLSVWVPAQHTRAQTQQTPFDLCRHQHTTASGHWLRRKRNSGSCRYELGARTSLVASVGSGPFRPLATRASRGVQTVAVSVCGVSKSCLYEQLYTCVVIAGAGRAVPE